MIKENIMNNLNTLWIAGEENPHTDTTYKAIKIALDRKGIDYISDLSSFQVKRSIAPNEYQIFGFLSDMFIEIRYLVVSGNTSFSDYIFYLQEKYPDNSSVPFHFIEATKNGFESSGNMTDQRSEKHILPRHYFGREIPFSYFINSPVGTKKVPKNSNLRATRRMVTCGVEIIHSFIGDEKYSSISVPKFSSVEEFVKDDKNLSFDKEGNIIFDLPLWNSKNNALMSDPNIGRLCSIMDTLRSLNFKKQFSIQNHNIVTRRFQHKNKMSLILNVMQSDFVAINVEGIGKLEKQQFSEKNYINFVIEGEKLCSIALENILSAKGHKIIFSNHAGSEKGFILNREEELISLPRKDEFGQKLGIPDLVTMCVENKKIYFFEAERLENKNKGLKQIYDPKFVRGCKFIMKLYPEYSAEIHLATYGKKCDPEIFYSLDTNDNEMLNLEAESVLTLESLP